MMADSESGSGSMPGGVPSPSSSAQDDVCKYSQRKAGTNCHEQGQPRLEQTNFTFLGQRIKKKFF